MAGVEDELKVLFIEDDLAVAEMYRVKLELDGYAVTISGDGEEGLRVAKKLRPDLIFLDIRLPKIDGFHVLERLRRDPEMRHTPVIILSNYGEAELVQQGLELGALDYLVKSETTPTTLARGVRKWTRTTAVAAPAGIDGN